MKLGTAGTSGLESCLISVVSQSEQSCLVSRSGQSVWSIRSGLSGLVSQSGQSVWAFWAVKSGQSDLSGLVWSVSLGSLANQSGQSGLVCQVWSVSLVCQAWSDPDPTVELPPRWWSSHISVCSMALNAHVRVCTPLGTTASHVLSLLLLYTLVAVHPAC